MNIDKFMVYESMYSYSLLKCNMQFHDIEYLLIFFKLFYADTLEALPGFKILYHFISVY